MLHPDLCNLYFNQSAQSVKHAQKNKNNKNNENFDACNQALRLPGLSEFPQASESQLNLSQCDSF